MPSGIAVRKERVHSRRRVEIDSRTSLLIRPERTSMRAFASEHDGERGSPGAGADDSDLAHRLRLSLLPNRFSVPASRRRMFWWCLAMMRAAAPQGCDHKSRAWCLLDKKQREHRKRSGCDDGSERNVTRDGNDNGEDRATQSSTALGASARERTNFRLRLLYRP